MSNTSRRRRGRSSWQAMADRRRAVFQLRQLGYTVKHIAGRLGVSGRTVLRDLDSIGQELTESLPPEMIEGVVVDVLLGYKTLHEQALAEHARAKPESTKRLRALQLGLRALSSQHRFMKCVRLFPRRGLLDLDSRDGDGESGT